MRWVRVILLVLIATLVAAEPVRACLWDRDTLAMEASGLPGVIDIIVGRFERNPPLYYVQRLDRVMSELDGGATDLSLYDDAGVACDRLKRHDDAIDWMVRKRAALDALPTKDADHEYRYLANLGTFHAHRWFANGKRRDDLVDLEKARDLIAQAIELNPDAHFGREKYQLMAIEWIIDPPQMHELPNGFVEYESFVIDENGTEAIEGLCGLIVLGNAWESVDVYAALKDALYSKRKALLGLFAEERVGELVERGGRSVHPNMPEGEALAQAMYVTLGDRDDFYNEARAAAEAFHEHRTAFMLERLERGKHPDTDADFWVGYVEIPAPTVPGGGFLDYLNVYWHRYTLFFIFGGLFAIGLIAKLIRRWLRIAEKPADEHQSFRMTR